MKKFLFSTIFILSLLIFTQIDVLACSCPDLAIPLEQEIKWKLKELKAVFSGKVIEIKDKPQSQDVLIRIKLEKSWKRKLDKEVIIETPKSSASCGAHFEVGKSYLVFANETDEGNLGTSLCLKNRELEKAAEELKILDNQQQTIPEDTLITLERKPNWFGICPFYKMTISSDGKVEIEPKYFKVENKILKVVSGEIIKSQITQDKIKQLISAFEKIDFYSLNSTFEDETNFSNCPQWGTDQATAITSITVNGKSKQVEHYHGCRGTDALKKLSELEDKIDEVVNINQLLKCDRNKMRIDLLEQPK